MKPLPATVALGLKETKGDRKQGAQTQKGLGRKSLHGAGEDPAEECDPGGGEQQRDGEG